MPAESAVLGTMENRGEGGRDGNCDEKVESNSLLGIPRGFENAHLKYLITNYCWVCTHEGKTARVRWERKRERGRKREREGGRKREREMKNILYLRKSWKID